ncbi:tetratricopeptide repeat protein [Variovorax saccharolyticus]|uniref:tetratricopeptide repeat protein n=1 Tax=Variovorax saccharolyticus TaxID=3053516 RepID=UPI0025753D17|nr:tetratricopeptide repeat protein [Variovorax sp. J22R187]MDM0019025.1 tetratricopeptide repeat protein [Variovorax sp. J22R187]
MVAVALVALGVPGAPVDAQQQAVGAAAQSAAAITDMRALDPAVVAARLALLSRAEAELARGDTQAAIDSFDRAAMMLHAPDTEMGLVRAYMQAGQYRRALAFCAHVAGAHRESAAAGALYAWLLRAGGQAAVSESSLRETLGRTPQDPVAIEVRRAFAAPSPVASVPLLQVPHRMAPQALMMGTQPEVPKAARLVSSGVLIADGTMALVPGAAARAVGTGTLWVRNGLGRTTRARIEPSNGVEALGLGLLRLEAALDAGGTLAVAPRDAFAGSPGFAVAYTAGGSADPAWPLLSPGFLGAPEGDAGLRRLGIEIADGPHGGPVLDAGGRLAGIVLRAAGGEALMLPASRWQDLAEIAPASAARIPPEAPRRSLPSSALPLDEAYERGLRVSLQVLALPGSGLE